MRRRRTNVYSANPAFSDTDDDRFDNGSELTAGTDPLDTISFPAGARDVP